ncbi:extracellular solute-binding protein [Paenibacillaceae bacterium WGS1546]|uniref:sugar ABC transporter substrate-binding protein n=1 Tax=Cohnella sp. WGS1546 TaxID=3366810 RepID=UPI00372CE9F3
MKKSNGVFLKSRRRLGRRNIPATGLAILLPIMLVLVACSGDGEPSATEQSGNAFGLTFERLDTTLEPEPGASLVVWENNEARPFVEAIAKEFTALYGIPVKMEELRTMDQLKKLELDGPEGLAADVVTMGQDHLGKAVTSGLFYPNDDFAEQTRSEHEDAAIQAATYGGELYGYPIKVMTYAMFYNKALIPEPPKTMEEVIAFAETFNDPDNNRYAYMFDAPYFYFSYPFIGSTGGYIFGNNGTDPNDIGLNNEGAVKGLQVFAELRDKVLPLSAGDIASDIKSTLFSEGKVAMNVTGSYFIDEFRRSGVDFGLAPIPSIAGEPSVALSQVNSWFVNAYTKYPNAAKLFARFASTHTAQLLNYHLTGAVPTQKLAASDPAISADELTMGFYEQFSRSHSAPSIPEVQSIWTSMDTAMEVIWEGGDIKQTLDQAAQNIRDIMELNRQNGVTGLEEKDDLF